VTHACTGEIHSYLVLIFEFIVCMCFMKHKICGFLTDWRSNGALYARISPSISCSMGHMHWVMLGYVNSSCVCVEWNTKPLDLLTNRLMVVFCTHMWIHCFCVLFDICIGWMWIQRVRLVVVGFIMMLKFCWHGAIVTTHNWACLVYMLHRAWNLCIYEVIDGLVYPSIL
jgi:hypothetical protein